MNEPRPRKLDTTLVLREVYRVDHLGSKDRVGFGMSSSTTTPCTTIIFLTGDGGSLLCPLHFRACCGMSGRSLYTSNADVMTRQQLKTVIATMTGVETVIIVVLESI